MEVTRISLRSSHTASFHQLIDDPNTDFRQLRRFLDGLGHADLRSVIESTGGRKRQARLFQLAADGPRIGVDDMVSPDRGDLNPVIFHGRNSLPAFRIFQKRFCRAPSTGDGKTRLIGYNAHNFRWFTGPGYFVCEDTDHEQGQIAIDYTQLPTQKPVSWPKILNNKQRGGRMVYADMIDYVRAVTETLLIGRAVRRGKVTENYFLLLREA